MQPWQVKDDHKRQSLSSHTVCDQGHLTLHQPAEDVQLRLSKEAPGFAFI